MNKTYISFVSKLIEQNGELINLLSRFVPENIDKPANLPDNPVIFPKNEVKCEVNPVINNIQHDDYRTVDTSISLKCVDRKKLYDYTHAVYKLIHKSLFSKRIVVVSSQIPGNGGSATNAYNIHKFLLDLNFNSTCVFHENTHLKVSDFNSYNLKNVLLYPKPNVDKLKNDAAYNKTFSAYSDEICKTLGGQPDIILCKNYTMPTIYKHLFKNSTVIYLVAGSRPITDLLKKQPDAEYVKIMKQKTVDNVKSDLEISSINSSDFIFGNSKFCTNALEKVYDRKTDGEFYTTFLTMSNLRNSIQFDKIPMQDRKIDILFAVSSFDRAIKNPTFAAELFQSDKLKSYNKLLIGDNSFQHEQQSNGILCMEKIPNIKLLEYFNNAKIVILCSRFEAFPNTMLEAHYMGANIIISENCGGITEFINPANILPLKVDTWVDRCVEILSTNADQTDLKPFDAFTHTLTLIHKVCNLRQSYSINLQKSCIALNYKIIKTLVGDNLLDSFLGMHKDFAILLPDRLYDIMDVPEKYYKQYIKLMSFLKFLPDTYQKIEDNVFDVDSAVIVSSVGNLPGTIRKKIAGKNIEIVKFDQLGTLEKVDRIFLYRKEFTTFNEHQELIKTLSAKCKTIVDLSNFSVIV